jgi:hypothetical protein
MVRVSRSSDWMRSRRWTKNQVIQSPSTQPTISHEARTPLL